MQSLVTDKTIQRVATIIEFHSLRTFICEPFQNRFRNKKVTYKNVMFSHFNPKKCRHFVLFKKKSFQNLLAIFSETFAIFLITQKYGRWICNHKPPKLQT